ncbi:MAG: hypothetical protein QNJ97_17570 [Myxococcota bacterium]|nr:hypothetical protein [Myxococcota bacterium]
MKHTYTVQLMMICLLISASVLAAAQDNLGTTPPIYPPENAEQATPPVQVAPPQTTPAPAPQPSAVQETTPPPPPPQGTPGTAPAPDTAAPATHPQPPTAPAAPAPEPQWRRTVKPGRGLRISGYAMLGSGYLVSIMLGTLLGSDFVHSWYLYIPVIGSFMYGVDVIRRSDEESEYESEGAALRSLGILLWTPSLLQIAGAALAIAGHVRGAGWQNDTVAVTWAPMGPNGSLGLSLGGRFL